MNYPFNLIRQKDLIPIESLGLKVTIIGAGAIGSFTALSLAKMGVLDLTVCDFDEVSEENMNSQFFRHSDIGKPKVEALQSLIKDFTGVEIDIINKAYDGGAFNGLVISAVDSMSVRRLIFDNHKLSHPLSVGLIDPRMSAEFARVQSIDPRSKSDCELYEKTLFSDDDAVQERCTGKATVYTATMISGYVVRLVKDFLTQGDYPRDMLWSIKDYDYEPLRRSEKCH